MVAMITMRELLNDKVYKQFLHTEPTVPEFSRDKSRQSSPPWVVYVQREAGGSWGKREFWKYKKALKFMLRWLDRGAHDATINNKRTFAERPDKVVRVRGKYMVDSRGVRRQVTKLIPWVLPAMDGVQHHWCGYCRRPTVFMFYRKHKRLGEVDPTVPRCCICGASARIALSKSDRSFRVH